MLENIISERMLAGRSSLDGNISQVMLGQIGLKLTAEHPFFLLGCIIYFPVSCALGDEGQTEM